MRLCFAWTRKPPFKRWIVWIRCSLCHRGRLERHAFKYRRNGTLSLYAALDVKTGKVQGKTAERHTSATFVDFLEQLVSTCKARQEIHMIPDNPSAHKTAKVTEFLERNPNVKLHFTPTYSSRLNQVELWFSRLECEVIARYFHFCQRPRPKTNALHTPLRKNRSAFQMDI